MWITYHTSSYFNIGCCYKYILWEWILNFKFAAATISFTVNVRNVSYESAHSIYEDVNNVIKNTEEK